MEFQGNEFKENVRVVLSMSPYYHMHRCTDWQWPTWLCY